MPLFQHHNESSKALVKLHRVLCLDAQALSPSMQLWRKRLGDITSSFERAAQEQPSQASAAAPATEDLPPSSDGRAPDKVAQGLHIRCPMQHWLHVHADTGSMIFGGNDHRADASSPG